MEIALLSWTRSVQITRTIVFKIWLLENDIFAVNMQVMHGINADRLMQLNRKYNLLT